jgi:hypothetical protein
MKQRERTKRLFTIFWVIAAAATYCSQPPPPRWGVTPVREKRPARISIENPIYDFGKIVQGEKPVVTFAFSNTGDDILMIDQVAANIRNITTEVSHEVLLPGQEGSVKVTLDSTGLHGNVAGRIAVVTNDEKKPTVFIYVMAKVKPILALSPPFIFVGQVTKEGSFSGRAKLVGKLVDEGKLKTVTIRTSSPSIEAKIRQRTGRNPTLEFVLRPEQKAGTFEESITLVSKDPPVQAQLRLYGQKLGEIKFTPDRFEFFPEKGVKPDSRTVLFECDKPFHITKVEDLSGYVNLAINTIEEGRKYGLIARLKSPMEGFFLGVVKVYTDLDVHPLIHLPVIGGGSRPEKGSR